MTSNVSNQGIAHLSFRAGTTPFCRSRRAHITVATENAESWPRLCARCAKAWEAMKAKARAS